MSENPVVTYKTNASITAEQYFSLYEGEKVSAKTIKADFSNLDFELDPAPPCKWTHEIEEVSVEYDAKERTIIRNYKVFLVLTMTAQEKEAVEKYLDDEGYYSEDDGVNWVQAINYMIAGTTACQDYAMWDSEQLNIEHWTSESYSYPDD